MHNVVLVNAGEPGAHVDAIEAAVDHLMGPYNEELEVIEHEEEEYFTRENLESAWTWAKTTYPEIYLGDFPGIMGFPIDILNEYEGHDYTVTGRKIDYIQATYHCTMNPEGRWDWYAIGGRWDGMFRTLPMDFCFVPRMRFRDPYITPFAGTNPEGCNAIHAGCIDWTRSFDGKERSPVFSAYIDANHGWTEEGEGLSWLTDDTDIESDQWEVLIERYLSLRPTDIIVVVDYHN